MAVNMKLQFKDLAYVMVHKPYSEDQILQASLVQYNESEKTHKKIKNRIPNPDSPRYVLQLEVENKPTSGFKLRGALSGGRWGVIDPRGYMVSVSSYNLDTILKNTNIDNMEIIGECVWAIDGNSDFLIPVSAPEYKQAMKATKVAKQRVRKSELKPGCEIILTNGKVGQYLGQLNFIKAPDPMYERSGYTSVRSEDKRTEISSIKSIVSKIEKLHVWVDKDANWACIHTTKTIPKVSSISSEANLTQNECRKILFDVINKQNKKNNYLYYSERVVAILLDEEREKAKFSFTEAKYSSQFKDLGIAIHKKNGEVDFISNSTLKPHKLSFIQNPKKQPHKKAAMGLDDTLKSYIDNLNITGLSEEEFQKRFLDQPLPIEDIEKIAAVEYRKGGWSYFEKNDSVKSFYVLQMTIDGVTSNLSRIF